MDLSRVMCQQSSSYCTTFSSLTELLHSIAKMLTILMITAIKTSKSEFACGDQLCLGQFTDAANRGLDK